MPESLAPLVAVKGSIAVDGISLTVNEAGAGPLRLHDHPAHAGRTPRCRTGEPGDPVNLEADMLARYVARQLAFGAEP